MKSKLLCFILIFSTILITGCSSISSNKTNSSINVSVSQIRTNKFPYELIPSDNIKKVVSEVKTTTDKTKNYNNLKEIVEVSDYIFDGKVIKVSYFEKGGMTYTLFSVNVLNVYAGNLKTGDSVDVMELGGYTTVYNQVKRYGSKDAPAGMTEEEQKNSYVKIEWDGNPLTNVGDSLFLCVNKNSIDKSISQSILIPIGYTDGKFYMNDTKIMRKSSDPSTLSLEDNKDSFIKNINQYKIQKVANK